MKTTKTDIQIRFADTDMLRHINNVNLQHYFDLGKNDYFADIVDTDITWGDKGLITASTASSYMEQTLYNDKIYVESICEKVGNKSITLFQRIISHLTGKVHAQSRTVLVCYDFDSDQSILIPEGWRTKLEEAL